MNWKYFLHVTSHIYNQLHYPQRILTHPGIYMIWGEIREKTGSHQESNPGHLWLELPALCHWATTPGQPPTLTILYMYCTGGTECLSCTSGSLSWVCKVRTRLGLPPSGEDPCSVVSHSKLSEHLASCWQLKPEVSWVWLRRTFHFPLFLPRNIQIPEGVIS